MESFRYSSPVPGKAESRRFVPGRPFLIFSFSCGPFIISCFLPNLFQLRQYECSLGRRDGALPETLQQLPARSPGIWFRLSQSAIMADTMSTGAPCLNQTVQPQHRLGLLECGSNSSYKDKCKLWWLEPPVLPQCVSHLTYCLQALAITHPECRIMKGDGNCGWRGMVIFI